MSRQIIDNVVLEQNSTRHVVDVDDALYMIYSGNVEVGFPKVKIQQIDAIKGEISPISNIIKYYNGIQLEQQIPATLYIGTEVVSTAHTVIRILKAMFLGQCSKNVKYSETVSYVIKQLLVMCKNCEAVLPFAKLENGTKMQDVVVDELSKWVMTKLNEDGIAYTSSEELLQSEVTCVELESQVVDLFEDEEDIEF